MTVVPIEHYCAIQIPAEEVDSEKTYTVEIEEDGLRFKFEGVLGAALIKGFSVGVINETRTVQEG